MVSSPVDTIFVPISTNIFTRFSIPSPVFADIGRIELFILLSIRETIELLIVTFLLSVILSILFNRITNFCRSGEKCDMILFRPVTISSSEEDESSIPSTISASESLPSVLSIPIFSISSEDSLMPAVSMNRKGSPPRVTTSSMVSRVVPATGDTIALSSPRRELRSVLFPAFTGPTIDTDIPFFRALPAL